MSQTTAQPELADAGNPTVIIRPGVVWLTANNAGPLTDKGTNTYLVGQHSLAVIDPGPDDPAHCRAILKAAGTRPITHILITHAHRDHVDGAARLKAATGAITAAFPRAVRAEVEQVNPIETDFIDGTFRPDRVLADGDCIAFGDTRLIAIHTPGHAPDHVCFALDREQILFSGDHVMGWNTSVIAPPEGNMADYLASLERLLDRSDDLFLAGHGAPLAEPQRTVKAYLLHRRMREQSILEAVRSGHSTVRKIVPVVYSDVAGHLKMAATLSVLAHAEHLIDRGLLACDGPASFDAPLSAA